MTKLNFGCGADIREGWDNIDIQKGDELTTSFDFDVYPYPLEENKYDYVLMKSVIEHVIYPEKTLFQMHKCCKNGAIIKIITGHYSNKGAYNSMQHKTYLNEIAFKEFVNSYALITRNTKFKLKSLVITPSSVGRFIPEIIRNKLGLFINGLHSQIHVEYEVVK